MDAIKPEDFKQIAILIIGFLLGILGPIITDYFKNKTENTKGRFAIFSELQEIACLLALAAYAVRINRGTLDKSFAEWFRLSIAKNKQACIPSEILNSIKTQATWSDADFELLCLDLRAKSNVGMSLQHYPAPLLDSRVSALWTFKTDFQKEILQIKLNLHLLDDLVDKSRKYHELSFVVVDELNHHIIQENFSETCNLYAKRAQRTVDMINNLSQPA